ncbi:hypothetical protein WOLCODRAFT_83358 [Wolfiporia cocos MD-104 SS10]|uniref:Uncharacterized protein n=1 Tax=Wolfiporia cocos (strain MD-104) TaxID=742152 RepID=A0A2H3J3G8_WOLCO|nr:hypothetical protein WOLCODRAFT_83358 [Wolfiporia cocos MD-104 SS10]
MRASFILTLLAMLAIGASASPTPLRPDAAAVAEQAGSAAQQRPHVYSRRPRAHP